MNRVVRAASTLRGLATVPGDKSISHRAVILAALADGASAISASSPGRDVRATVRIVTQLGATVESAGDSLVVNGPADGLAADDSPLDCENSGTTMRLLCGVLGGVPGVHTLVGDVSLSRRPMDRVQQPLAEMGLLVAGRGPRVEPPLRVQRQGQLHGIRYAVPVPSAQVKSAVLLAGLSARGETEVFESTPTRANTEEMLAATGVSVRVDASAGGRTVVVQPGRPTPHSWNVPGDPSQAAYFVVAATLSADGDVTIPHLYPGAERVGFLRVLERMGADIALTSHEETTSVRVRCAQLSGTSIAAGEIPSLDEVPILAVAAAGARGETRFGGVAELRVKESDRFTNTVSLVRALGAEVDVVGDDFVVRGLGAAERFAPFAFGSPDDHRMVMAAAIAGSVGHGAELAGAEAVATSFPDFFEVLESLQ